MPLRVAVIVLCYNHAALTCQCLASVARQSLAPALILAVDNASTDETASVIPARHPQVSFVPAGDNLGYAGGNNLGLRLALERGADAVLLVNNDTVLSPACLSGLVQAVDDDPCVAIAGPMVFGWGDARTISSAGGAVDWRHADAVTAGVGETDHGQYPARDVDFVTGCGLLITRAAIERVGLLDERYFMYWEETDWCVRVRRAGWRVRFVPQAEMRHKAPLDVSALSPTTLYYVTRNRLLFFATHTPPRLRSQTLLRAVHGAVVGLVRHCQARHPAHARAAYCALVHACQHRWGRADPRLWQGTG